MCRSYSGKEEYSADRRIRSNTRFTIYKAGREAAERDSGLCVYVRHSAIAGEGFAVYQLERCCVRQRRSHSRRIDCSESARHHGIAFNRKRVTCHQRRSVEEHRAIG